MRARRIALNFIAIAAAVLLSGCYVTSTKLPASSGPLQDEQLIGSWRALDEEGKPEDTFLHILKGGENKPLFLAMVDNHNWTTYQVTSLKVGDKQMFALKQVGGLRDKIEPNYILGFYEVKGDILEFRLIDPDKIKAAVDAHQLKGHPSKDKYGPVVLTSSPQELAAFFTGADVAKLTNAKPARAQRIK